jgi:hypothetical protein
VADGEFVLIFPIFPRASGHHKHPSIKLAIAVLSAIGALLAPPAAQADGASEAQLKGPIWSTS